MPDLNQTTVRITEGLPKWEHRKGEITPAQGIRNLPEVLLPIAGKTKLIVLRKDAPHQGQSALTLHLAGEVLLGAHTVLQDGVVALTAVLTVLPVEARTVLLALREVPQEAARPVIEEGDGKRCRLCSNSINKVLTFNR